MMFTYLFTRQEKFLITNAAVLVLEGLGSIGGHPGGPDMECLLRFKMAVTDWINNTKAGKAAYQASSEDLNIGDLLNEGVGNSREFQQCCDRRGVHFVSCAQIPFSQNIEYDTHLYDQGAVDEWWERWEKQVQFHEDYEGMNRSDAQGVVDARMGMPPGPKSS